ncbi:MAG TPA: sigma-70 family RNA polymerase sigma factor [Bryobacteraceae bacterium]|jgi:RNA polymerase sigma factor (sigma-70 family)
MIESSQCVPSPGISATFCLEPSWPEVVDRIRGGDPAAMEQLYRAFTKGIRFFLYRQLGPQDLDDRVHDVFLMVTQSIRRGDLREPSRLMGYVRTVVRRHVAAHIDEAVRTRRNLTDLDGNIMVSDRAPDPERNAIEHQTQELALRILGSIARRDREVLIRFYLQEQSQHEICCAMNLTPTQFRLIKSRAKARFGELGKRRFARRSGFVN